MRRPRLRTPAPLGVVSAVLALTGAGLLVASLDLGSPAVVTVPVRAAAAFPAGAQSSSDPEALALVERAQVAARDVAYDGVKVLTRADRDGSRTAVVTVSHLPGQGTVIEADGTDGAAAETFTRSGSTWADLVSDASSLQALVRGYELDVAADATLAERAASVIDVRRADGTLAARLWVDRATDLLLGRELRGDDGEVVESSRFVTIVTGTADVAGRVPEPSPWTLVGLHELPELRAAGWPAPESLGGGFTLAQVRRDDSGAGPVLQYCYTDGLASVSVFVQRGRLDESALRAYVPADVEGGRVWLHESGSPLMVWQSGSLVVTATTDTLTAPLAEAVTAFPAAPAPADGVAARLERGVERVGSWLNPLA